MARLKELYAFIAEGPDGNEGIASIKVTEEAWLPLVAQTKEEIESYRPLASKLSEQLGKPVLLSRFTVREDLDNIQ